MSALLTPFRRLLGKLMARVLGHPALVRAGTQLLSKFPRTFNWLVQFARTQGLVTGSGNSDAPPVRIHSERDLSPEARIIYDELTAAIERELGKSS